MRFLCILRIDWQLSTLLHSREIKNACKLLQTTLKTLKTFTLTTLMHMLSTLTHENSQAENSGNFDENFHTYFNLFTPYHSITLFRAFLFFCNTINIFFQIHFNLSVLCLFGLFIWLVLACFDLS